MSSIVRRFLQASQTSIPEPPAATTPSDLPPITATRVPFKSYNLPEYSNRYALVIDNLFTQEDCDRLLSAAETAHPWAPAKIGDQETGYFHPAYRDSGRIIIDDVPLADWILSKIRPYLGEIEHLDDAVHHTRARRGGKKTQLVMPGGARLERLNERLRFLRYGPGQHFSAHRDAIYFDPMDPREVSYYTLQIYLNGTPTTLKGGATRFWGRSHESHRYTSKATKSAFVDVESRMGRVLIFEQGVLNRPAQCSI